MTPLDPFDERELAATVQQVAIESSASGARSGTDDATVVNAQCNTTTNTNSARKLPVIDGYDIEEELGRGGMGVVYRARQIRLNRPCALKMILGGDHANDESIARFLAEAEVVASLQHPNVIQIHTIGTAGGLPFFELELVEGGSLDAQLDGTPWKPRQAATLVEAVTRGVIEAHRRGIIHRDLKPGNILLSADATPKITDFGLAKSLEDDSGLTRSNSVLGSPAYMAPEQAEGKTKHVGPLADVYALGAILYQLITGVPPFQGTTILETLEQVRTTEPVPPSRLIRGLPRDIETISLKCLQKDLEKRYASAAALHQDLRHYLDGEPILARPVGIHERIWRWCRRHPATAALTGAVVLVSMIGLAGVFWEWRQAVEAWNLAARRAIAEADARKSVENTLADMYTTTGLQTADQLQPGRAALWFANAARRSRDDPERRTANVLRARIWGRASFTPLRAVVDEGSWPGTMTLHPNGRRLIARTVINGSTRETRCRLWDLDKEQILDFPGNLNSVSVAAFSPDGQFLAIGGEDRDVIMTGASTDQTHDRISFANRVSVLTFSADGRYLAIAGGNVARVWDVSRDEFATPDFLHPQVVTSVGFDSKSRFVATGCKDNLARLFHVPTDDGKPILTPVAHVHHDSRAFEDPLFCSPPAFGDEGNDLITYDGKTLIWSATHNGVEEARLSPPDLPSNLAAANPSPDGKLLAVFGAQMQVVRLINTDTGRLTDAKFEHGNTVYSTSISPDNQMLLTGSSDNSLRLWSVADGRPLAGPLELHRPVQQVAFAQDGRTLATQDRDLIRLWSIPDEVLPITRVPIGGYSFVSMSREGTVVIPAGFTLESRSLRATRAYDVATGEAVGPSLAPDGTLADIAFAPDGKSVAIASVGAPGQSEGHSVQIWDWDKGIQQWRIDLSSEPRSVAFRPDGQRLAVFCGGGELLILDRANGHEQVRWKASENCRANHWVNNGKVIYTEDGQTLLTFGMANDVSVWDAGAGKLRYEPIQHQDKCHGVELTADGRLMALASYDGSVRIRQLMSGNIVAELPIHPDNVYSARFSPDGNLLVTACRDRAVRVWDWKLGQLVSPPFEHGRDAVDAVFTASGQWVVSISAADQGFRAWDWRSGKPITPSLNLPNSISLAVTPDSKHAVVGGFTGSISFIDLRDLSVNPIAGHLDGQLDALCNWAELLSGQRLHPGGGTANLSADEWLQRWRRKEARSMLGQSREEAARPNGAR